VLCDRILRDRFRLLPDQDGQLVLKADFVLLVSLRRHHQEAALRAAGCDTIRAERRSGTTTQGREEL
jgi:hypothetical protein